MSQQPWPIYRPTAIVRNPLPPKASLKDVSGAIERLIALVQATRRVPRGPVIGLWAELFLMANAHDSIAAVRAWHDDPFEAFDFGGGEQRIEVKSSGDRTRRHHFSIEQAYAPAGTYHLVASILVEPATGGTSLGELWDHLRDTVAADPDLALKIDRVCVEVLGASWREARGARYDGQRAADFLLVFDACTIPRVAYPVPVGVSEVHFRADLSIVPPLQIIEATQRGGIFASIFGKVS